MVQQAGILTYGRVCERLPNNISDIVFAPRMAAYSCGTVGELHPVP